MTEARPPGSTVAIEVERVGQGPSVGSGLELGPRLVLTAKDAVAPDGQKPGGKPWIRDPASGREFEGTICWEGPGDEGGALVAVAGELGKGFDRSQSPVLAHRPPEPGSRCEMHRCLEHEEGARDRTDEHLHSGQVASVGENGMILEISFDRRPTSWSGILGAPLFSGETLIGIIIQQPDEHRYDDPVRAVSTASLLEAGLQKLLDPRLARSEEDLRGGLGRLLEGTPALRSRLAAETGSPLDDVLDAIARSSAANLAQMFHRVWIDPQGLRRQQVLEALRWAMPLAQEWTTQASILADPAPKGPFTLEADDPAGVHIPRARMEGRPIELSALTLESPATIEIRLEDRALLGFDRNDDGLVDRVLRGLATQLSVGGRLGELPREELVLTLKKVILTRQASNTFAVPWLLFADYLGSYATTFERAAKEILNALPTLVVVLARGSPEARVRVDVLVGDVLRTMMLEMERGESS